MPASPPNPLISSTVASSTKAMQSQRTFPAGVRTRSARCPIAKLGIVWISNRSGSSCRHALTWLAPNSSGVVQACPVRGTYCRASSQTGQQAGGDGASA